MTKELWKKIDRKRWEHN